MPRKQKNLFEIETLSNFEAIAKQVPFKYREAKLRAGAATLNQAARRGKTQAIKLTRIRLGVPRKAIAAGYRVKPASMTDWKAELRVRSRRPINVIRYGPKQSATQTADGVRHGAWQPGQKKKLATGAFLMPKNAAKKAGRTATTRRPGNRAPASRRRIRSFTKTVDTHFVAKRVGTKIRGLFGGWPVREFTGRKGGAKQRGVALEVRDTAVFDMGERFVKNLRFYMGKQGFPLEPKLTKVKPK